MNISHVNMGGRDQSQVKNKSLKSSKKVSPFRKDVPKSHNDDSLGVFSRCVIIVQGRHECPHVWQSGT